MPDGHASTSDPSISGVFRRPFTEQVAFFRRKLGNLVPTERWDDMLGAAHDDGFMVAGAVKADLLTDLAAATDKAIAEGTGLEAFRADFRAIVARHGWTGWTGEGSVKGEAWRVKTIYRTNMMTSYAAGRMAQLRQSNYPLWVYFHGGSLEPRLHHLSWNGWAGPPDHPFWKTHYPPSDWGCSCYVLGARSARGVRRLGGDPDKQLPANWQRIDRRTGAPIGIGKGWNYAPGASVAPTVQAMAGKVRNWDYTIAKAFMSELPPGRAEALSLSYRDLPSTRDDARRYAQRVYDRTDAGTDDMQPLPPTRTMGIVGASEAEKISNLAGFDVRGFDVRFSANEVRKIIKDHGNDRSERQRGQRGVIAADYSCLPLLISSPDTITGPDRSERNELLVHFAKTIDGERYAATFVVTERYRSLSLKTLFIGIGKKWRDPAQSS